MQNRVGYNYNNFPNVPNYNNFPNVPNYNNFPNIPRENSSNIGLIIFIIVLICAGVGFYLYSYTNILDFLKDSSNLLELSLLVGSWKCGNNSSDCQMEKLTFNNDGTIQLTGRGNPLNGTYKDGKISVTENNKLINIDLIYDHNKKILYQGINMTRNKDSSRGEKPEVGDYSGMFADRQFKANINYRSDDKVPEGLRNKYLIEMSPSSGPNNSVMMAELKDGYFIELTSKKVILYYNSKNDTLMHIMGDFIKI